MSDIMQPLMGIGGQPLSLFWKGAPGDYTSYTRLGVAYATDPSGSIVEVLQDVPPYEYVDGTKRFRQLEPDPVTVNKGTTSLLAEDIGDASYLFTASESDNIETTVSNDDFSTGKVVWCGGFSVPNLTNNMALIGGKFGGSPLLRLSTAGNLQYWADTNSPMINLGTFTASINTDYKFIVAHDTTTNTITLHINGVEEFAGVYTQEYGTFTLTYGRWSNGDLYNGNQWDNRVFNRVLSAEEREEYFNDRFVSGAVAHCPLTEYREDTFVRDISGNGNHGTASRSVDNLIQENQGFGYPVNLKAPTPFTSNGVPYGVRGLLNGVGDSVDAATGAHTIVGSITETIGIFEVIA